MYFYIIYIFIYKNIKHNIRIKINGSCFRRKKLYINYVTNVLNELNFYVIYLQFEKREYTIVASQVKITK